MLVMKFGGTSVRDAVRLRRAVAIAAAAPSPVVVVVSAAAGVTRRLLELGGLAAGQGIESATARLDVLAAEQRRILDELEPDADVAVRGRDRLERLLERLRARLAEIAATRDDTARAQDSVLVFGERLSAALLDVCARQDGLPVEHVPASLLIVTDDRFRRARPDLAAIERNVADRVAPVLESGRGVVTEGFIGATPEGLPTTMGFEASDLTAALLGAALDAEQIQIWTDVPGMLTTGHPAVGRPRLVPRLTFDEAAELALFGAKVLHPGTVAPARARGIPVRILESARPQGEGTWIADGGSEPDGAPRVKAIAVTEDADDDSFAEVRATLVLEHPGGWDGRAIVCPVGGGIGEAASIREQVRRALDGLPSSMPLRPRPHALPVAIARDDAAAAVVRLHAALIEAADVELGPCAAVDDEL